MSFRSKADRVIGQLQLKILGTEIKDDSSTRKARPLGCYLFLRVRARDIDCMHEQGYVVYRVQIRCEAGA